jgi:hypothetical protein
MQINLVTQATVNCLICHYFFRVMSASSSSSSLSLSLSLFFNGSTAPCGPRPPHVSRLHDHTFRHTTLGRTPLDEGPARRRDIYLTTHNTYKRQTSMPPVGFEPTIPASKRPQTHALDSAATGIGYVYCYLLLCSSYNKKL